MPLINPFKAALREGRVQIGLWQSLANPNTAEISATAGFDWLLFDGEHGPNDVPSLLAQLQAVSAYPGHAIARPPNGDANLIKQYLDIGVMTLLIPFVETAEQAEALVRAMRYPPAGIRGIASPIVRASRWNSVADYLDAADEQVCLLVQIETRKGLENLEAIAAIEGVDGIFIGPSDLSASLGHRGDPEHPDVQAAIADAIAAIRRAGKAAGILAVTRASGDRALAQGCTFVAVGTDVALFAHATRALATSFKGVKQEPVGSSTY